MYRLYSIASLTASKSILPRDNLFKPILCLNGHSQPEYETQFEFDTFDIERLIFDCVPRPLLLFATTLATPAKKSGETAQNKLCAYTLCITQVHTPFSLMNFIRDN